MRSRPHRFRRDFSRMPRREPPWWPEGESWPPSRMRRWHRPGYFLWRALGFFFFVVLLGGAACAGTIWLARFMLEPGASPGGVAWLAVPLTVAVVFALVAGVRRLAMPLGDLIEAAGRVEAGDYSARVHTRGPHELRLLGRAFNDMAERLELTEAQRRNLLADVTHELRTPVAVIQGNLEGVLDGVYPPDEAHLAPLLEEVRQLSHLIDDLRTLSQSESGALELHREATDLAALAYEVVASFRPRADGQGVQIAVDSPADLPAAEVDPVRIREVLVNLMANSLRHTSAGGRISVQVRQEAGRLSLAVEDSGSGISAEDLPHVFDRFYKSKSSAGSGLGLTIAKHLVEAHGGEIVAQSAAGQGTSLRFTLPLTPPPGPE